MKNQSQNPRLLYLLSLDVLNQKEEFLHRKKVGPYLLENSLVELFWRLKYHDRLKNGAKRLQKKEHLTSKK